MSRRCALLANASYRVLAVLGVAFIFFAFDELLSIHEKITRLLRGYPWIPKFRGKHGIWIFVYLLLGVPSGLLLWRNLHVLSNRYSREIRVMLWGATVFVFGAVVLEIIKYQFLAGTSIPYIGRIEIVLEEMSEMMGASLILYGVALLRLRLTREASEK